MVDIDFKGTSKASGFGINVPPAYTRAYSAFAVKCIVAPEIPNNAGSKKLQAPMVEQNNHFYHGHN